MIFILASRDTVHVMARIMTVVKSKSVTKVTSAEESRVEENSPAQSSYPRITIAFSPVPVRVFPDLSTWSNPRTSSGANLCS
jgi:hypothetical protein